MKLVHEEQDLAAQVQQQRQAGQPVDLPSNYSEFALWVDFLRESGALASLRELLLARRAGSYELVDLVAFLSCFFSASTSTTCISDFAKQSALYGHELAAFVDRKSWMKQASVSRALESVDEQCAREGARVVLESSGRIVTGSPLCAATGYRDGQGRRWQVLHWDTSCEGVRKRALPHDDDLAPPRRNAESLAKRGYGGRKRGEVFYARSVVSDATSAAWVHVDVVRGSGEVSSMVSRAVDAVRDFVGTDPETLSTTLMVCDGVSGGKPQTRAVLEGGLHVLTRNNEYARLESKRAAKLMASSRWLAVEDSGSGPRREAIDLGIARIDGHRLRVIASRLRVKGKRVYGAGRTIGQWHYELFLTSLPTQGWAANDIVTLYYGRTAIENRLAAEDREFNLSRTFSYHRPGQALACAVGMSLWNFRLASGLASVPPASPERAQAMRTEPLGPDAAEESERSSDDETPQSRLDTLALVHQRAHQWCEPRSDWSYLEDEQVLLCPQQERLVLSLRKCRDTLSARFVAPPSACNTCKLRSACMPRASGTSSHTRKEVSLTLGAWTGREDRPRPDFEVLGSQPQLPVLIPCAPSLLPAVLRRKARELSSNAQVSVLAKTLEGESSEPDHLRDDPSTRQKRRLSRRQRLSLNARQGDELAHVQLRAGSELIAVVERLHAVLRSG